MQEARVVDLLQPVEQRSSMRSTIAGGSVPSRFRRSLERLAARQRHHHVGGAVGLEEVVDAHDRRRAVERRQGAGLFEEALAAPDEFLGQLGRARQHRRAALAQRQRRRQIFLDRDFAAERGVARRGR